MITFEFHGFPSSVSQAITGPSLEERAKMYRLPSNVAGSLDVSFVNGASQNRSGEKTPYIVVYMPDEKWRDLLMVLLRSIRELHGETPVKVKFLGVKEMEL